MPLIPAPTPTPTPTPTTPEENVKHRIIDWVLHPSQIKLADKKKQIVQEVKKSNRKRNRLALEGISDHLSFMDETIEQIVCIEQ